MQIGSGRLSYYSAMPTPFRANAAEPLSNRPAEIAEKEFLLFLAERLSPEEKRQGWGRLWGASKPSVPIQEVTDWIWNALFPGVEEPTSDEQLDQFYEAQETLLKRMKESGYLEEDKTYSVALGGTTSSNPYDTGYRLTEKGYAKAKE